MKPETVISTNNSAYHSPAETENLKSGETPTKRIVTTSWDDGDPFDLRVAEVLAARKLPGTFYIPLKGHHKSNHMSIREILELESQGFEIGSHGVSHPNLSQCDKKQLLVEVEGSKKQLEDDVGKSISMFAYPRGRHNGAVIAAVKQAGYEGARTTAMLGRTLTFDPFRMPTSVQVYPHTRDDYFRNLARGWDFRRGWVYATHFGCAKNWVQLAKVLFESVRRSGGLWHLYGHSWEIDELGLWDDLKEVLDYVAYRPEVTYVSNSTAVQMSTNKLACGKCAAQLTTP